jgi:hypothetical protein
MKEPKLETSGKPDAVFVEIDGGKDAANLEERRIPA